MTPTDRELLEFSLFANGEHTPVIRRAITRAAGATVTERGE